MERSVAFQVAVIGHLAHHLLTNTELNAATSLSSTNPGDKTKTCVAVLKVGIFDKSMLDVCVLRISKRRMIRIG